MKEAGAGAPQVESMIPQWLRWAQALQAIAQNGLAYSQDVYERERFTAVAGIAAEIFATHTQADARVLAGLFAGERGHATPKVDTRAAVFQDGKILLVRERADGLWTLPGGWVDVLESPREAVEREVWEESGYRTRAVKLLAVWDRMRHPHPPHAFHIYKLIFRCEVVGGAPAESIETDGVGFFSPDELPPLSLGRTLPAQITRLFEHYRDPNLPTDFD
jgi:ADP-ribose pyrophosphatase YjhB (NUDIX family)